jgi:hypothetical protein
MSITNIRAKSRKIERFFGIGAAKKEGAIYSTRNKT